MDFKKTLAPWIGLFAIVAFAWFVRYLLQQISVDEQQWTRSVFIFGGVEAVAFSAIGYFFGKEVHRERAEKAEDRNSVALEAAKASTGKQSAAEQKLYDLSDFIQVKRSRKASPFSQLEWLEMLGSDPAFQAQVPDLLERAKTKLGSAPVVADPDWDELLEFTQRLVNPVASSGPHPPPRS